MTSEPSEPAALRNLLTDSFTRIAELMADFRGCPAETATARLAPDANTIAWLLWHLARVQDDHIAGLAGRDQVWADGWFDRLGGPFEFAETGYGHTSAQVAQVTTPVEELIAYHADVHAMTIEYVGSLRADDLAAVIDDRWDPPVTAGVRLVSVIGDCLQHLGQAEYVRGIVA